MLNIIFLESSTSLYISISITLSYPTNYIINYFCRFLLKMSGEEAEDFHQQQRIFRPHLGRVRESLLSPLYCKYSTCFKILT